MCSGKSFYVWLLRVIVLLGLLALSLWLALHPKDPNFTIVEFTVPRASNQQNSSATGGGDDNQNRTLIYTIEIGNSNKDSSIYYDDILLIFYFGNDTVGKDTLESFSQNKDKSIREKSYVDSSTHEVEEDLFKEIPSGKAVVKVDLTTKVRYKTWGIKSKRHGINLHGSIPVGSDGKISGKKKKVKLSKKWRLRAARFL